MNENGLSASDIALMTENGGGGFGNSFMWIFGLLILMGMFNGNWGNNNNNNGYTPQYATQADVQNTAQYGNLLDGNRDILSQVTAGTAQTISAVDQSRYDQINVAKDMQSALLSQIGEVKTGQAQLLANQNACCSNTRLEMANQTAGINQNIMQNRYEGALNTAAINDTTVAQTQKILDAITGNRIADMQNQINQLQLANGLAGVMRYPSQVTYTAPFPFPPAPPVGV